MTWRYGLLRKLYAFGLRGNLPCFIQNLISDRTFAVKLFSDSVTYSDIFVQANGVPQGSVLSPTIFLCMINVILPAPLRNLKYCTLMIVHYGIPAVMQNSQQIASNWHWI